LNDPSFDPSNNAAPQMSRPAETGPADLLILTKTLAPCHHFIPDPLLTKKVGQNQQTKTKSGDRNQLFRKQMNNNNLEKY